MNRFEININIGCIETTSSRTQKPRIFPININIGCIETFRLLSASRSGCLININIGCIETYPPAVESAVLMDKH